MDFINIFEAVVFSSLAASVIVVTILVFMRLFRDKLSCAIQYYIWLVLLIKLIVPFGPQTSLSISNIYEKFCLQSTINENIQNTKVKSLNKLQDKNFNTLMIKNVIEPSNENKIIKSINITSKSKISIKKALCFLWISGSLLLSIIIIVALRKLRIIIKTSVSGTNITHEEILYSSMKTMNINTSLEILYSSKISSPSLCGLIKPKILIPINLLENITYEEFRYIIMH